MEKISNNVTMSVEEAKDVCKLGQGEKCCAFLVMGSEFECSRMTSIGDTILARLAQGSMNAKGQGGWEYCAWDGYF